MLKPCEILSLGGLDVVRIVNVNSSSESRAFEKFDKENMGFNLEMLLQTQNNGYSTSNLKLHD